MSKLFETYKNLKNQDSQTAYLFKSGIFYIFLAEDAENIGPVLNLKSTKLNDKVIKCGFPISAYDKYLNILKQTNYNIKIIDLKNNIKFNIDEFYIENSLKNLINKIQMVNTENLSVSEAYSFIEEIKTDIKEIKI